MVIIAAGPLDAAVAWDGWVGAIIGGLVSFAIAWGTVRATLRYEDKKVREDRELAGIRERNLAFADVLAALAPMQMSDGNEAAFEDDVRKLRVALSRWRAHLTPGDDEFEWKFRWGCNVLVRRARKAVARQACGPLRGTLMHPHPDVISGVGILDTVGRRWHKPDRDEQELISNLVDEFPHVGRGWPLEFM